MESTASRRTGAEPTWRPPRPIRRCPPGTGPPPRPSAGDGHVLAAPVRRRPHGAIVAVVSNAGFVDLAPWGPGGATTGPGFPTAALGGERRGVETLVIELVALDG